MLCEGVPAVAPWAAEVLLQLAASFVLFLPLLLFVVAPLPYSPF